MYFPALRSTVSSAPQPPPRMRWSASLGFLSEWNDRWRCVGGFADDVLLDEVRFVLFLIDRKIAGRDTVEIGVDDELVIELTHVGYSERLHLAGFPLSFARA